MEWDVLISSNSLTFADCLNLSGYVLYIYNYIHIYIIIYIYIYNYICIRIIIYIY